MGPSEKFWNKIATKYSKQPIADEESYQRKLRITRSYLSPDSKVVELGCGTGSTAIIQAPYVKHIQAFDISSRMIEIARDKAKAQQIGNISFTVSEASDIHIADNSIDMVLTLSFLHLVDSKEAVIKAISKMLKPGGMFISSTICLNDDMKWLKLITPLGKLFGAMPMIRFFSKRDLENCIQDAGFRIEESWQPGKRKAVFIVARKL